jgi:hypothetical protein
MPSLPRDTMLVGIELLREIVDEETDELLEEHIIDVTGQFFPAEADLGDHIEVVKAVRTFPGPKTEVELTDEEVDSLVDLLEEQRRR